jgi:APA family basic amino acid/polyamine antiporter
MARKLPGLQRIFGAETIFAIVYGEVSSSLYFALGVVSLWALGLTPLVLLGAGLLFGLAAAAYQEGVRTVDQPGGSAAVARHAFGDLAGFVVGWAVVLDFGVVIALSLLFVPHYALAMVGDPGALTHPADELIAVGLAIAIAGGRLIRRPGLYRASIVVAGVDIGVQLLLAVLGLAVAFHPNELTRTLAFGAVPSWNALAFSIPLAMIAFTGLEIVALVMREVKKPADTFARGMVSAVLATIVLYAVIATVALTALPVTRHPDAPSGYASDVSERYLSAPLAGVARAVGDSVTSGFGGVLRAIVAASAVLILMFSAITAFSGAARVLRGLGDTSCLPGPLATTNRRFATSPYLNGIVVATVAGLYAAASLFDREVTGLASIYSFGLMLAFMAVFLAVIKLRVVEPSRPRPVMMRGNMRFGRSLIPLPAVAGFLLSWLVWLLALGTHRAGRVVPPLWLLGGVIVFLLVRRRAKLPILGHTSGEELELPAFAEVPYGTIIVPCKQAGPIEDEMLATASKLAQVEGGKVIALKVIEVPLEESLDCSLPEEDRASRELLALCESFAADYGIEVECRVLRARAISSAVAHEAREADAGLILIGAVPRPWDAAGRAHVFSDTVENVIRRSHCRVIVTSFPAGTASVDADRHAMTPAGHGAPVKVVPASTAAKT